MGVYNGYNSQLLKIKKEIETNDKPFYLINLKNFPQGETFRQFLSKSYPHIQNIESIILNIIYPNGNNPPDQVKQEITTLFEQLLNRFNDLIIQYNETKN